MFRGVAPGRFGECGVGVDFAASWRRAGAEVGSVFHAGEGSGQSHGFAALRAVPDGWRGLACFGGSGEHQDHAGEDADAFEFGFGGGVAKPVVAHGVHAAGQDVPEVAADELDAGKGLGFFDVAVGAVFPAEGDVVFADVHHAAVADGGLGDVGAEVFDGGFSGADGADVDAPFDAPDGGIDRPVEQLELLSEGVVLVAAVGAVVALAAESGSAAEDAVDGSPCRCHAALCSRWACGSPQQRHLRSAFDTV